MLNAQIKSAVLEYLINISEAKDWENKSIINQIKRAILYLKYWLKGTIAIGFQVDVRNYSSDLDELDGDIGNVIIKSNGDLNIVEECLNYFESKSDISVGEEYCINVLRSAKVRLKSRIPH
jgi:hypothetical protein